MPITTWHNIKDIVGIGASTEAELNAHGFYYTESLLKYMPASMGSSLEFISGLTKNNLIENYCPQARLLRLRGMEPSVAHDLLEGGYDYSRIAYAPANTIKSFLENAGHTVNIEDIYQWQLDAAKRRFSSTLTIEVTDTNGQPVVGADVYVNNPAKTKDSISWRWQTNNYGDALVEYMVAGFHEIIVLKDEKYSRIPIVVSSDEFLCIRTTLQLDAPDGVVYDEAVSGPVSEQGAVVRTSIDQSEIKDGSVLHVTEVGASEYRLTLTLRKKKGTNWYEESIKVPRSAIAAPLELLELVQYSNGSYTKIDGTWKSYREQLQTAN